MKLQHFAIIFLIVILPFSIICRNTMNNYSLMLKDQVRLNNVIDAATQDALDMLVELNDEFQVLYFDQRFDITQSLAEESVKSFFKTMAISFNMPYIEGSTQSYFSMYIPAIVIVAYDGFFIYSVNETNGTYAYQMSPKIPYAYFDENTGTMVHFTLGNYIKLYTNDTIYEGEFSCNYFDEALEKYNEFADGFATTDTGFLLNAIPDLTSDMSILLTALYQYDYLPDGKIDLIPDFLIAPLSTDPDATPFLRDYDRANDLEASTFHQIRRNTIISVIQETLQEEINEHTTYASMFGSTYHFSLPEIARDDWMNSINDISVMSFIQGMPIGTNMFYDNYALSGSRIIQTEYYYGTNNGNKYYHRDSCTMIQDFMDGTGNAENVDNIFITREQAAEYGYYPCNLCHP